MNLLENISENYSAWRSVNNSLKSVYVIFCYFLQKQNIEIKQLKKLLEDESGKLKNGMKLDMNLERSRVQEVVSIANEMPRIGVMNLERSRVQEVVSIANEMPSDRGHELREVTSTGSGEYSQ